VALAIVTTMEARLAKTNRKFRYRKPVADFKRTAATAWSEGVNVLFWGHFHTLWRISEGDHLAMVIPAWLETNGAILVTSDGRWSWVDTDLEPVPLPDVSDGPEVGIA
jgi:hypothetical protein